MYFNIVQNIYSSSVGVHKIEPDWLYKSDPVGR